MRPNNHEGARKSPRHSPHRTSPLPHTLEGTGVSVGQTMPHAQGLEQNIYFVLDKIPFAGRL